MSVQSFGSPWGLKLLETRMIDSSEANIHVPQDTRRIQIRFTSQHRRGGSIVLLCRSIPDISMTAKIERAWQAWSLRLAASILRNSECVVLGIRFIRWLWAQPLPDLAIKQYLQSCTDSYVGPGGFSTATTGILKNHVSGAISSGYPTADIASRCHENLNCSAFAKDRYWQISGVISSGSLFFDVTSRTSVIASSNRWQITRDHLSFVFSANQNIGILTEGMSVIDML